MAYPKAKSYREFLESYGGAKYTEAAFKKARVEAQVAYDREKSAYGDTAEALAAAGLTRSGYRDYLRSKAQAALEGAREKISLKEAQKSEEQFASYQKYLDGIEKQKISARTKLYRTLLSTRTTRLDTALRMASVYGLTDTDAKESAESAIRQNVEIIKQELMDKIRTERTSSERAAYYGETYALPEDVIKELTAFAERLYGKSSQGTSYDNYTDANQKGK